MAKDDIVPNPEITGEEMIRLLHEDLAGEYQVIIAYTPYDPPETERLGDKSDRTV